MDERCIKTDEITDDSLGTEVAVVVFHVADGVAMEAREALVVTGLF